MTVYLLFFFTRKLHRAALKAFVFCAIIAIIYLNTEALCLSLLNYFCLSNETWMFNHTPNSTSKQKLLALKNAGTKMRRVKKQVSQSHSPGVTAFLAIWFKFLTFACDFDGYFRGGVISLSTRNQMFVLVSLQGEESFWWCCRTVWPSHSTGWVSKMGPQRKATFGCCCHCHLCCVDGYIVLDDSSKLSSS